MPVAPSTIYITCVFVTLLMTTFALQTSHSQRKHFKSGSNKVLCNLLMSPDISIISQTLLFPLMSCTMLYLNATLHPMIPHTHTYIYHTECSLLFCSLMDCEALSLRTNSFVWNVWNGSHITWVLLSVCNWNVFYRTMLFPLCLCWKACTWRLSAAWEDQASL